MTQDPFEILLPAGIRFSVEEIFHNLEIQIHRLASNSGMRKRGISVAMELFQNLQNHRNPNHLGLLRIRSLPDGNLQITTLNLVSGPGSEKLATKFHILEKSADLRQTFQNKLAAKAREPEVGVGDFGLEFCFRKSKSRKLQSLAYPGESQFIVFVSFTISNSGVTQY
jgi:hypothetical protein